MLVTLPQIVEHLAGGNEIGAAGRRRYDLPLEAALLRQLLNVVTVVEQTPSDLCQATIRSVTGVN